MRIARLKISNYKGIRRATVDNLSTESAIVISGKNGTGKSLLLEAILATWTGHRVGERDDECIGPWSDAAKVELDIMLTSDERKAVSEWSFIHHGHHVDAPEVVSQSRSWNRNYSRATRSTDPTISILTDDQFRRTWGFATIDHIPPNRNTTPARGSLSVDLGIFGEDRLEQERKSHLDSVFRWRGAYSTGDVLTYLATVDYLDQIATRSGGDPTNEFDILARNFHAATGKTIYRPRVDPNMGVSIEIETAHGERHEIAELSIGEHEALNLMYLVRRLNAQGGILLLDEPEQHLHPTLQVALFETMTTLAGRAQVLAVSHSPSLIASIPPTAILEMSGPREDDRSQLSRSSDDHDRSILLHQLGLRPSALVQSDAVVIVEGNSDEAILRTFFPIELSRCRFVVAGGVNEVMNACKALEETGQVIPWICIRDRDLVDDEERARLISTHKGLFIWRSRMLENVLVDPELIANTFNRAGFAKSKTEVSEFLREAAKDLQEEVLHQLVQKRLTELPPPGTTKSGKGLARLRAHYDNNIQIMTQRLDAFDTVVADVQKDLERRWGSEWHLLAHGKSLMAKLVTWGPFSTREYLINALAATFIQEPSRPVDLTELGERIREMLYVSQPSASSRNVSS